VYCKFLAPVRYDDIVIIETSIDDSIKGGMKFGYRLLIESSGKVSATGYTRHACVDRNSRVVRPPKFLQEVAVRVVENTGR